MIKYTGIKLIIWNGILFNVNNKVFYLKPKVSSNVVKFKLKNIQIDQKKIMNFTSKIFSNKRKSLRNKLKNTSYENEVILRKRVEELNFDELLEIYNLF